MDLYVMSDFMALLLHGRMSSPTQIYDDFSCDLLSARRFMVDFLSQAFSKYGASVQ